MQLVMTNFRSRSPRNTDTLRIISKLNPVPDVLITELDPQCKSMSFRLQHTRTLKKPMHLSRKVAKKFIEDCSKFINGYIIVSSRETMPYSILFSSGR